MDRFKTCSFVNETQRIYGRHIRSRNQDMVGTSGQEIREFVAQKGLFSCCKSNGGGNTWHLVWNCHK